MKANNKAYNKGKEVAEKLAQLINTMGHRDQVRGFLDQLKQEHRTLQQQVFELFLQWTYELAATEYYDLRNETSIKRAKQIKATLGEYGDCLPFI